MSIKNRLRMKKIWEMNDKKIGIYKQNKQLYHLESNKSIDDIKLPEGLEAVPYLYDDGETMQMKVVDKETKQVIGLLDCKKTHEMLEQVKVRREQLELEREKERQKEKEEEKKRAKEREEQHKQWVINNQKHYDRYIKYLLEKNANKEILELKAVKDLIMDIIERSDFRVRAEGRSPINYPDVREDGTFDIRGRTAGPTVNEIYKINLVDDGEVFIQIDEIKRVPIPNSLEGKKEDKKVKTIFVNKEGEIITPTEKKSKTM